MTTDAERVVIEGTCRQLMMRYAAAMNLQAWDRFLSIFAPDVFWERPGMAPMRSHQDIRTFFPHLWQTRREVNPNYLDVPLHDGVGPAQIPNVPELVVFYQDVFSKLPQGWRITEHQARHLFRSPIYTPPSIPDTLR